MLNTGPTPLSVSPPAQALQPSDGACEAGPSRTASKGPSRPADVPPGRRPPDAGGAGRAPSPAAPRAAAPFAPPRALDSQRWAQLDAMKDHLAELREAFRNQQELPQHHDGKFIDLLVRSENARDPLLRLSHHAISVDAVRSGGDAARESVAGLAGALVKGMKRGEDWHAVLKIDDHHVAVSARHHPRHPSRVSLVVVDGLGSDMARAEWQQIAELLCELTNRARTEKGKDAKAQVWISCLNPPILRTSTGAGSDAVALAIARKMRPDLGLLKLHKDVMGLQARHGTPTAVEMSSGNSVLGAPLFKLMTRPQEMDAVMRDRPELETAKVNGKGQTLREYQEAHTAARRPPFGMTSQRNVAYEEKRLSLYDRAVARLESKLAPGLAAMQEHLERLRLAAGGHADLPPARDAKFLDMLMASECAKDPSLRLRALRLDPALLAQGASAATEGLWRAITEGLRKGEDWSATLDIAGHHVALSARHDAEHPSHVSLVVMQGAGGPFSSEDWKQVTAQLNERMQALSAAEGVSGKIWVTHLDLSASLPGTHSTLFALIAAKDMRYDDGIAEVHADAWAQAASHSAPAALRNRPGDHLLDPDAAHGTGDPMTSPDVVAMQIEMYEQAVGHYEMILKEQA